MQTASSQLVPGSTAPRCEAITADGRNICLADALAGKVSVIFFLRDYACVLSQYEMSLLTRSCDRFVAAGLQLIAIVETSRDTFCRDFGNSLPPYTVLCDPAAVLYKAFAVGTAVDMETLGNAATMARIAQAKEAGFKHGPDDEGDRLRLPAVFVVDAAGILQYCHYGKTGEDLPAAAILLQTGANL